MTKKARERDVLLMCAVHSLMTMGGMARMRGDKEMEELVVDTMNRVITCMSTPGQLAAMATMQLIVEKHKARHGQKN